MKNNSIPDYKKIFLDILAIKFPEKKKEYQLLLNKDYLTTLDVIELNKKIFGINIENEKSNQKYRSYNKNDIFKILDYQKKNKLNNTQLANHFKLSRNTITKWKKKFKNN